ncbi:GNAT family N-acetyltransferase [Actinomyces vulturis]|uniref:GNAT family N-acetyltransferase n=1 Tax=Actinomyces vulturis TaxID=1857645 RepID=UPI00082B2185|nr:GNAT family N-acetyltransferase [Actinomyces vulturis]
MRLFHSAGPHPIAATQREPLEHLCATNPYEALSLAHQLRRFDRWGKGDVVIMGTPGNPIAGAWTTGTAMPVGLTGLESSRDLYAFAKYTASRLTRRGSVMGPHDDIEILWRPLEVHGVRAREFRWNQPVLRFPEGSQWNSIRAAVRGHWAFQALHAATLGHYGMVMPASCAMFEEEVGYDPQREGGGYARHVRELLNFGRTFVVTDDGHGGMGLSRVVFKADVGSLAHDMAGLTGVWTHPEMRGLGIARAAMVAVVDAIRVSMATTVTLYVNDFNTPARRLYDSLGASQVGTMSTILL